MICNNLRILLHLTPAQECFSYSAAEVIQLFQGKCECPVTICIARKIWSKLRPKANINGSSQGRKPAQRRDGTRRPGGPVSRRQSERFGTTLRRNVGRTKQGRTRDGSRQEYDGPKQRCQFALTSIPISTTGVLSRRLEPSK
jgi:hypothetical protein